MDFDTQKYENFVPSRVTDEEAKILELFGKLSEDKKQQALKMMNDALYSDKDKTF
jgi:hypothetical protein